MLTRLSRLIQSLCAVCGSNLAGLTQLYIVPPCVADVSIVNCAVCQQFNKRTLFIIIIRMQITQERSEYDLMTNSVKFMQQTSSRLSEGDSSVCD